MAQVKKNIVTEGLSGKLGGRIVFSNRGGKTIVSVMPEKSDQPRSDAQKAQQRKFVAGVTYAKKAVQDPTLKEAYQMKAKEGQGAYHVAVNDYLNAPDIESVDLTAYTGKRGEALLITAVDDYSVASVEVLIHQADGTLFEQGAAVPQENGSQWAYTTQKADTSIKGKSITVRVKDLPGNTAEAVFTLG